jgi:hypothetical protein
LALSWSSRPIDEQDEPTRRVICLLTGNEAQRIAELAAPPKDLQRLWEGLSRRVRETLAARVDDPMSRVVDHTVGPPPSVTNSAWGVWGGELARRLVAESGVLVLRRFMRLTRDDSEAVLEAAAEQLVREGPLVNAIEARVRHAVFDAAVPIDRRRWIEEMGGDPDDPQGLCAELSQAARRASLLTGRERQVFLAVCALDDVAEEGEVGKVVLHTAVAYKMRWNTAHQHLSRAWRRIGEGGLSALCKEWRAGQRFVCPAPSVELWAAARTYLDACNGRGGFGGAAFDAWIDAHEDHNGWFNEWKKQSSSASQQWRACVAKLDASGVHPGEVAGALVSACRELGFDRGLAPAQLAQQSWRELLVETPRPTPDARRAWRTFLLGYPVGAEVDAAFRALEREAALAEVASAELERAYKRLLRAGEQRSGECIRSKDDFRRMIDGL